MYGREPRLPIDIVYGTQSQSSTTVDQFVQKSHTLMEQAYSRVREQKDIYDKRIHDKPYKAGETVWLFDTVVERGQSKKFHQGPTMC